jgi:hypothetical protein
MTKQSDYVVVLNPRDITGKAGEIMSYFNHPHTFKNWDFVTKRGESIDKFDNGDHRLMMFDDLTRISFGEWQRLPEDEPMEQSEPEIITEKIYGYKLIKPQYHSAVKEILNAEDAEMWFNACFDSNLRQLGCNFKTSVGEGAIEQILRKAGVLDLWFEPVYETEVREQPVDEPTPEPVMQFSNFYLDAHDIEQLKRILNNDQKWVTS